MKIAIISPGKLPIPSVLGGAIETLTTHLIAINDLDQSPFEFTVYNQVNSGLLNGFNYKFTKIYTIKQNRLASLIYKNFWRLLRKISGNKFFHRSFFIYGCIKHIKSIRQKYDYILVEGEYSQVIQLKRNLGGNIILHLHTDILNIDTPFAKQTTEECNKIICVSNYLKSKVTEINNLNEKKSFVLKNCIDINRFNRTLYENFRLEFRKKIGINEEDKLIIFCGRLSKEKGVRELLLAFEKISSTNNKLLIVGSSWFSNNQRNGYIESLQPIVDRLKDKLIFTGYINHEELPQYYASADIAVCPSIGNEAAGLVILEALASSLPVIVSDKGGIPEYASTNSCEIVQCNNEFVNNLSRAIEKFLSNKSYFKEKKKNARESVLEYNLESYYRNFQQIMKNEVL